MAALDDRIGSQFGRPQMVETFHEPGAGKRLRGEGGGRETLQLFRGNSKRVYRVEDRLAFPTRQGLRNLAILPERDRQDDRVGIEGIPQRIGNHRWANRPRLRRQRFGRPAARDGHVDVFTGEGMGEGLTYLAESYDRVAHHTSPIFRWPRSRRRQTSPPRSRSSNRPTRETARPSQFPRDDPSFRAGSGIGTYAS